MGKVNNKMAYPKSLMASSYLPNSFNKFLENNIIFASLIISITTMWKYFDSFSIIITASSFLLKSTNRDPKN